MVSLQTFFFGGTVKLDPPPHLTIGWRGGQVSEGVKPRGFPFKVASLVPLCIIAGPLIGTASLHNFEVTRKVCAPLRSVSIRGTSKPRCVCSPATTSRREKPGRGVRPALASSVGHLFHVLACLEESLRRRCRANALVFFLSCRRTDWRVSLLPVEFFGMSATGSKRPNATAESSVGGNSLVKCTCHE